LHGQRGIDNEGRQAWVGCSPVVVISAELGSSMAVAA
jgi:hypothetical protein